MRWQLVRGMAVVGLLATALTHGGVANAQVNVVPNGDFEVDADASGNPDSWFSGGAIGYVSGDDSSGAGTQSVSAQNGGDWRSQAFPVVPGASLTYLLDYKVSPGATGTIRSDLRFFTSMSGGGTSGMFQGEFAPTTDVATVPQGVWNTLGPFTVTVPAGSAPPLVVPAWGDVRLSAGIFGPALVGTVQYDNVRVLVPEPATTSLAVIACGMGAAVLRRARRRA
jgi:hypothetical protein